MTRSLSDWQPLESPSRVQLEGTQCILEPIRANVHGEDLYRVASTGDGPERFRWLPDYPPKSREQFEGWLGMAESSPDPMFFAVRNAHTGQVEGRQALMRIDAECGVVEMGHVLWGAAIARTKIATEAFYLFTKYAFDELQYRRFEWKAHNDNKPSLRAATRFGMQFEGKFRQHRIAKGANRDTAWFSMLDSEWPLCKEAFERWLAPGNFSANGQQVQSLAEIRGILRAESLR